MTRRGRARRLKPLELDAIGLARASAGASYKKERRKGRLERDFADFTGFHGDVEGVRTHERGGNIGTPITHASRAVTRGMTLRLRTFGAVYLERDDAPLGGVHTQRRRLALLAFLAASKKAKVTRDRLVALFWPDGDAATGRHALSQLIYAIRRDLGADAVVGDGETVCLNPSVLASDVDDFDESIKAGQFERAVECCRGAFLEGFYVDNAPELERWIEDERARRNTECGRAVERLAEEAERAGDFRVAADHWRSRAALTPMDGRVVLRLMRALAAVDDRAGAVQAARVYETLVRDELDVEPDAEVLSLARQLRVATPSAPAPPPARELTREPVLAHDSESAGAPAIEPRRRVPAWRGLTTVAVVVVVLVAIVVQTRGRYGVGATLPATAQANVVLGDLDGPDSVLTLAVREALRAELSNTPRIHMTSDLRVRSIRSLMRVPLDAPLHPPSLLEVATRSGAHVAISGSVVPLGNGAQIVVDLHDPSSGRALGTFAERPSNAADLMNAVERLGRSLRAALLQSPVDTLVRSLPSVTTTSLAALKSYALARRAASSGRRGEAVDHAERAVTHDSSFVLAHYFLGDLLWFIDEQSHAEAHLTRAFQLSDAAPPHERLVVRARYTQLVRDRPDSALTYWDMLRDAAPSEPLGYEGRSWALRALGRYEEAAAAADSAMRLERDALAPNVNNTLYSLLSVADTTRALTFARGLSDRTTTPLAEAQFWTAISRGDARSARTIADAEKAWGRHYRRFHADLLARNRTAARASLDTVRSADRAQELPRVLLAQGWYDAEILGDRRSGAAYARETLEWVKKRDLSPPAVGRLSERIGDLAARVGDTALVADAIALVKQRDHGRSLPSYVLALRSLAAAAAYARRNPGEAARLAAEARNGVYFSRSMTTVALLQADALSAAGDRRGADSLYRLIERQGIADGDFEVAYFLRGLANLRTKN
jgi:DNA-binding SARP family transcriptional activator